MTKECLFEGHSFITGRTRSGKTFYAANMAKKCFPRFIFVNVQYERVVSKACDSHVESVRGVMQALHKKKKAIEFVPSVNPNKGLEQLRQLRMYLFEVGKRIDPKNPWITVIIDEIDIYAPKGMRTDLLSLFQRGARFGIRAIGISQRPQLVHSTVLNQVSQQVIFESGMYSMPYFSSYAIPYEEHKTWVSQKYHYIIFDGINVEEMRPI